MTVVVKRKSDYDDELRHFKYIKREKKNGKWVYYYDHAQLKKDVGKAVNKAVGIDARNRRNEAYNKYSLNDLKRYISKDNKNNKQQYALRDGKVSGKEKIGIASEDIDYKLYSAATIKVGKDYVKAEKEFQKTPLGKLEKTGEKIASGLLKVEKLFKKAGKKFKNSDAGKAVGKAAKEVGEATTAIGNATKEVGKATGKAVVKKIKNSDAAKVARKISDKTSKSLVDAVNSIDNDTAYRIADNLATLVPGYIKEREKRAEKAAKRRQAGLRVYSVAKNDGVAVKDAIKKHGVAVKRSRLNNRYSR